MCLRFLFGNINNATKATCFLLPGPSFSETIMWLNFALLMQQLFDYDTDKMNTSLLYYLQSFVVVTYVSPQMLSNVFEASLEAIVDIITLTLMLIAYSNQVIKCSFMIIAQLIGIYFNIQKWRNIAQIYINTHQSADSLNPLSAVPPSHTVKLW